MTANAERRFVNLRKRLDQLGYRHPLGVDSLPLVEKLFRYSEGDSLKNSYCVVGIVWFLTCKEEGLIWGWFFSSVISELTLSSSVWWNQMGLLKWWEHLKIEFNSLKLLLRIYGIGKFNFSNLVREPSIVTIDMCL